MINFNEPILAPHTMDYLMESISNKKLSGDGEFTKRCTYWLKCWSGVRDVFLTTSCTHATEMAARGKNKICGYPSGYNESG